MSSEPDRTRYGTLLPGYDQPVLLAEALQVPAGHVLDLTATASPLGYGHDHDDDHDDDHAYGDEHGRRSGKAAGRRDVLITAFDKGPEAPGIRTRIFKLRHAHDFSCSGRW
jgi:hypothetical protein